MDESGAGVMPNWAYGPIEITVVCERRRWNRHLRAIIGGTRRFTTVGYRDWCPKWARSYDDRDGNRGWEWVDALKRPAPSSA